MIKSKICTICDKEYTPFTSTAKVCSVPCAIEATNLNKEKKLQRDIKASKKLERKDLRERKDKLKSRSDHLRECQTACNAYIRERDKGLPCISCGTQKPDIQYCAGHFKTRGGHPELRFHPMNINKKCNKRCNLMLSGNISD